ncbi:MAG: hypothetical protein ACI8Y4_001309 [Candidatus Poriferisodalaceae bacterium]|jgi:hypothetical protein
MALYGRLRSIHNFGLIVFDVHFENVHLLDTLVSDVSIEAERWNADDLEALLRRAVQPGHGVEANVGPGVKHHTTLRTQRLEPVQEVSLILTGHQSRHDGSIEGLEQEAMSPKGDLATARSGRRSLTTPDSAMPLTGSPTCIALLAPDYLGGT